MPFGAASLGRNELSQVKEAFLKQGLMVKNIGKTIQDFSFLIQKQQEILVEIDLKEMQSLWVSGMREKM